MPKMAARLRARLTTTLKRLKGDLVEEVPKDLAQCEFGCKKHQCLFEEWSCCERRLAFMELSKNAQDRK